MRQMRWCVFCRVQGEKNSLEGGGVTEMENGGAAEMEDGGATQQRQTRPVEKGTGGRQNVQIQTRSGGTYTGARHRHAAKRTT